MTAGFDPTPAPEGALVVQGFVRGGFKVAGEVHGGAVLVTPDFWRPWAPADPARLTVEDFAGLRDADPPIELVLVGTGARGGLPDVRLAAALMETKLAAEFMGSRAAARTYNVLVAEGRRVAAALLPE